MEFVPQPEDAKKFGIKWLKWNIMKYPTVFITAAQLPFLFAMTFKVFYTHNREMNQGIYVPYVITNRYAVIRPDEWQAQHHPKRYTN